MEEEIILILEIASCLTSSFLGLLFISWKKTRDQTYNWLGVLMLVLGLIIFQTLSLENFPDLFSRIVILMGYYAMGPILLLFSHSIARKPLTLPVKLTLLLPFIYLVVWYSILRPSYDSNNFFTDLNDFPSSLLNIIFAIWGMIIINKNRDPDSLPLKYLHANLINSISILMVLTYSCSEILEDFKILNRLELWLEIISYSFVALLIYGQLIFVLRFPDLFTKTEYLRSRINKHVEDKYQSARDNENYLNEVLARFHEYISKEENYTNNEISMEMVSDELGISSKDLSQALNYIRKKSFRNYLNEMRIEKAGQLLKDNDDLRISEVMYEVGFNSKSNFNKLFKERYGNTPKRYQEESIF